MSSSEENSHQNVTNNNIIPEHQNQEEPKNIQEQRSIIDPSTELGTGINELNSRNNSTYMFNSPNINIYNINNNNTNRINNNILLDEEDDEPESIIQDSAVFDAEEYYSYNLILNAYFNRQIRRNLNFDNIKEKISNFFNLEKNEILEEKEEIKKSINKFKSFKESYLKQKRFKNEELKKIYSNENDNNNIINNEINIINNNNTIQIEFSTGEIIKEDQKILTKYQNSILAACINKKISLPKRNNIFFFDRNYSDFKLLLYYLKKSKLPKFKTLLEEKNFFKEIDFWKIPIKSNSKKLLQFDINYSPNIFNIDKSLTFLTKKNNNKGIILLNKKLKATSSYIEFILSLKLKEAFLNKKKFLIALIDKKIFTKEHLLLSFENKSAPFVFYWDVFNNHLVKNKNKIKNWCEIEKNCLCYMNNYEIKFGIKYDQKNRSIKLYKNDIELNIEIKNIEPGLIPAFELNLDECKIQLLQNTEHQDIFYL